MNLKQRMKAVERDLGRGRPRIVVFHAPDECPKADAVLMAEQGKVAGPDDMVVAINKFHARCEDCACKLSQDLGRNVILVDTGVPRGQMWYGADSGNP